MNKFDEIVKKKIGAFDSPYPDHMWESIARQLPEKKRRPYGMWFMFSLILLTLAGFTYFTLFKFDRHIKTEGTPYVNMDRKSNKTNQEELANLNSINAKPLNEINTQHQDKIQGVTINELNDNNNVKKIRGDEQKEEITNRSSKQALNVFSNAMKPTLEVSNTLMTPADMEEAKRNGQIQTKEPSTIINLASDLDLNPTFPLNGQTTKGIKEDEMRKNNFYSRLAPLMFANTTIYSEMSKQREVATLKRLSKKYSTLVCPTFVKKQNTKGLELYISNDYAIRDLTNKRGDGVGYINLREESELPYISNSIGARVSMGWESGISFKTGINFSQIKEKFSYTDPNSIQIKTIRVVKYLYDGDFNKVDSIVTTETVQIPGANTIVKKNKYNFFDIPILFQYSVRGSKRLSYDISAGPYINLWFSQSGQILDTDAKHIVNLEENSNIFRSNIGLSFYGSFAVNYQLTKTMKISIEPNVKYMPNSLTNVGYNLDQKYIVAGLAAGVKFKI